jgi:serine/threonine-protein kinase
MGATIGERLRDYEIVRLLGRGGMACVFEARHVELGHLVAIKVMHPELAANRACAERFLRGARNAARIQHPHVARIYDVGSREGVPFLVMHLVGRETLATRLHREGPFAVNTLVDVFLPIVSAVAAAHALGIVHRDLKPANVALAADRNGGLQPSLLDFGTSRSTAAVTEADVERTHSDALVGTIPYMSPEQVRAASDVDERTDQYALGVMLYECATGSRPFAGETPYDLMHAIVTGPLDPPSLRRASLPPEFDAIVLRAMQRDPAARFASVEALGAGLLRLASPRARARWIDEFEGEGPGMSSDALPSPRTPARMRWLAAALGGAAALGCAAALGVERRGHASGNVVDPPPAAPEPRVVPAPLPSPNTLGSEPGVTATVPAAQAPRVHVPTAPTASSCVAPGSRTPTTSTTPPRLGTNLAPILE